MFLPCNMVDWVDRVVDKGVGGLFKVLWEAFIWGVVVMGLWRVVRWYPELFILPRYV